MFKITILRGIPLLLLMSLVSKGENISNSFCFWTARSPEIVPRRIVCRQDQFQCVNNKCIPRGYYCDGGDDCGDNSDEQYCSISSYSSGPTCRTSPLFIRCLDTRKCIPEEWICNGHTDCPSGDDETNCERSSYRKGQQKPKKIVSTSEVFSWLYNQKSRKTTKKWGSQVDKSVVLLFFADRDFSEDETIKEMAYEVSIQLLHQLSHMKLEDVPTADLASYVNAFLVMCLNPRKFHGFDLVQELESRIEGENYTNPYVLLALCNAGYSITEYDKRKLLDTFNNKRRPIWTDTQALVIMALSCAGKTPGNEVDQETLRKLSRELMQHQYRNGSVESLQTTALVMQALISTGLDRDPDHFDEIKALEQILRNQESDGSFGDLMNTYYVTPILSCRSLADINSDHCHYELTDENTALENLATRSGPKIRVEYSLWIGNGRDLERNLVLKVPANMSMYGIMEIAAEVDSRYRFEYTVKNGKPYIISLSGLRDNPEKGKFWFLFTVQDGKPSPSSDSPAEVIPKENDHFVMWYRSGSWVE